MDTLSQKDFQDNITGINTIYNLWLTVFPFDLSCHKHLKEKYFEERPPLNDYRVFEIDETYEGVAPLFTRESFYDYLCELTLDLLEKNNYKILFEQETHFIVETYLAEIADYEYVLRNDKRRLEYIDLDLPYCKIINDWIESEKIFLKTDILICPKARVNQVSATKSLREIALFYTYTKKQITRDNGDEIASEYGHKSGGKLYQYYLYYSSVSNRKGRTNPFTKTTMRNKIELFEKVVEHLSDPYKQRAVDELSILNELLSVEFEQTL
jgi:hypothetical protein